MKRVLLCVAFATVYLAAYLHAKMPNPFREWPAFEYENFPLPPDYRQPTEWTRARLRYTVLPGYPSNYWTMDYPRSDRHLLQGIRRLTSIDTRSVEQVVAADGTEDMYNWPTLYAVEVGHWDLEDKEAAQLRDFINRGGFLMVDDFHADAEWEVFMDSLEKVFPDSEVVDIPSGDPIFHTVYDLSDRVQVPGAQYLQSGRTYEKDDSGRIPHWRAVYDKKGRIVVAICHNMDLGDAWEWSDDARYPEKWAGLAYRIAVNYFTYDFTH